MPVLDFVKNGPILFIGCHPDDVELGCGGLINKLQNSVPIYVLTLSKNQDQKNPNLMKEHFESLKSLGVRKSNIIVGNFVTREFSYSRQEILDFLIKIRKKIKPTCVFTHASDLHQDHQVCHDETMRAFRNQTIIEYFVQRSMYKSKPTLFAKLSQKDLDAKIHSLSCYKTFKSKQFFLKDSIISMCKSQGVPLEIFISESFNPIWIIM